MPQLQVVDLSPLPAKETTLDKTLQAFNQRYKENQETDALSSIYKEYQQGGQDIERAIEGLRTRPGISPSTRAQSIKELLDVRKINAHLQSEAAKQERAARDRAEKMEANKRILSDLEARRGLNPGELAGYAENPSLAEQITRPKGDSKKTQASQPIDEDQLRRIQSIRSNPEFVNASTPKQYQMLTEAGVSKENAKTEVDVSSEERKLEVERAKASEAQAYKYHKDTAKQDEEIFKGAKGAKNQLEAIKDVERALASGNVRPNSLANVFKGLGVVGQKISEALINKDEATVQASIPAFLEGRKELFGVRITDADLKLLSDKLPGMGKSIEANKAILNIMKRYSQASLLRSKIASSLKKDNGNLRPLGYLEEIDEKYDEMTKPIKVINPKTGRVIEIPAFQLNAALQKGARLVNE